MGRAVLWWMVVVAVSACGDDSAPTEPSEVVDASSDGEPDGGSASTPGDSGERCEPPRELEGETALPAEIADILERRCWVCHGDPIDMFAPMSLVTWEQLQAPRKPGGDEAVYRAIERRIHDERFPMPPVTFEQLTEGERATMDAWFADCAPRGN